MLPTKLEKKSMSELRTPLLFPLDLPLASLEKRTFRTGSPAEAAACAKNTTHPTLEPFLGSESGASASAVRRESESE